MPNLAAVVEKPRAEEAISALRNEGVYDDSRHVIEHDDESVELPVIAVPHEPVGEVIEQTAPELRARGLPGLLRARGWTDDEVDSAPGSWAVVGDIVLVRLPDDCPRPAEVGEALCDLQGVDTAVARQGIEGPHREPEVEVLAGTGDTETVHTEAGTQYALDLARVMFSPGNRAERVRMGQVVDSGERVFDMFAGIGYFALPMARAGASVTAIERNPTAFSYLVENGRLNEVDARLTPVLGDCRELAAVRAEAGEPAFDRVVMGHYDAGDYLDAALSVLAPGGVVHLHDATPEANSDRPVDRLKAAAGEGDRSVEVLDRRRVKGYSPGVQHVVVDARVA